MIEGLLRNQLCIFLLTVIEFEEDIAEREKSEGGGKEFKCDSQKAKVSLLNNNLMLANSLLIVQDTHFFSYFAFCLLSNHFKILRIIKP